MGDKEEGEVKNLQKSVMSFMDGQVELKIFEKLNMNVNLFFHKLQNSICKLGNSVTNLFTILMVWSPNPPVKQPISQYLS